MRGFQQQMFFLKETISSARRFSRFQRDDLTVSIPAHIFAAWAPHAIKTTPFPPTCDPEAGANRFVTTLSTAAVNWSHPAFACDPACYT